jgi:hypothetical protein
MLSDSEFRAVFDLASRWTDGRNVGVDCKERPTHRLITMVNGGHPADGRQGWDLMEIDRITSEAERDRLVRAAKSRHWAVHSAEADKVTFYKPTGAKAAWNETEEFEAEQLMEAAIGEGRPDGIVGRRLGAGPGVARSGGVGMNWHIEGDVPGAHTGFSA